jgi:polyphosphate kinase 2 (PPK2 family)
LQHGIIANIAHLMVIFEWRDVAGKGGVGAP